jgi:16S rRNA G966 N2-methylase RsmD
MKSKAFDHSKYPNWIDPETVLPYERNAKQHTEKQIKNLVNSINRFGWQQDVVITSDNVLVIGHGRRLAALKIGCEMPYHRIDKKSDALTDADIRELRIADNQTNAETGMDFSALEAEIEDLSFDGFDFDFGFDFDDEEEPAEIVEDEAPEEVETRCKLGDIWQLGEHRLICGDSTDVAVIDRLMDGVKADCVFTDAPYGVSAVNSEGTVIGDSKNHLTERGKYAPVIGDDTTETAQQAYDILSQICDKLILWGGNYFLDFLPPSDGWLIWDKRGESGIRNNFADGEMAWCSFHTPVRIYHQLWNGMIREGEHEKRVHPTQKPIKMLSEILQDFTKEGDIILDVFGGSGSTLIACEQLNRKCYMCELDPHYCDVIIQRWENLTGKKAVLLNV